MALYFCSDSVAILSGILLRGLTIPLICMLFSMMDPKSKQAESIYHLTNYFFIAAAFILLLVTVLTIIFLYKYKDRGSDKEPPQIKSGRIEILMVGVPLAMVAFFFVLTVKTMKDVLPRRGNMPVEVIITGHQWWWEATYPQYGVHTANEIHLPVGRKVLLQLNSADVIHDWWVPQLGNKMDLIPGRDNYLWLTIQMPGVYEGACSEFCGQEHAWMRIHVYAQPETEYRQWLMEHKLPAALPQSALAQQGTIIFQQKACGNCHRISGTLAAGTAGPDLTHLMSRKTLLTGILNNNYKAIDEWLTHPQKIKPGAYMPDFHLDEASRNALVTYLTGLK